MNKIRQYIRKIIIAEATRKAPLLNFDDEETEDMTDLDMSRVELTQAMEPLDIDEKTPISKSLSPLFLGDDDEDFDDDDEEFDVEELSDFYSETEEDSESRTFENPLPKAAYDPSFRIRPDMTVTGDPMGRTPPEIKKDVDEIADELELGIDKTKKSDSQREAEFLKRMEDLVMNNPNLEPREFPTDPAFAPIPPEDTAPLPLDRKPRSIPSFFNDKDDLNESIKKLIRNSIRKRILEDRSKNKLYKL